MFLWSELSQVWENFLGLFIPRSPGIVFAVSEWSFSTHHIPHWLSIIWIKSLINVEEQTKDKYWAYRANILSDLILLWDGNNKREKINICFTQVKSGNHGGNHSLRSQPPSWEVPFQGLFFPICTCETVSIWRPAWALVCQQAPQVAICHFVREKKSGYS